MKVAVVGGGVSGLAATWLLNEHSEHEVHLIEANDYPGGHTHTVRFTRPPRPGDDDGLKAPSCWVDTGFIVFNTVTYPNLLRFLQLVGVDHIGSDMSFAVSRDRGKFEWAGGSLGQVFAQRRNLLSPGHWRMVWHVIRFNTYSTDVLKGASEEGAEMSIGTYLEKHGYSNAFRDNYILPMTAAIWSTPPDRCALDFPARTLIRFMHNHHLLQILDRPQWLTIPRGSHRYVDRVLSRLPPGRLKLNMPVTSITQRGGPGGKRTFVLRADDGHVVGEYDHVVLATHADQALKILEAGSGADAAERDILGQFAFSKNVATLHSDTRLMPTRRSTWSAWNYLTKTGKGGKGNVNEVALTYWMNLLQSIPEDKFGPVCVTLNPPFPPAPELTAGSWEYEHPLYTAKSVRAQKMLPSIQNVRGITFAGAWTNYGFHEDGFTSGLRVATHHLGAACPFDIRDAERDFATLDGLGARATKVVVGTLEVVRRLAAWWIGLWLVVLWQVLDVVSIPLAHASWASRRAGVTGIVIGPLETLLWGLAVAKRAIGSAVWS